MSGCAEISAGAKFPVDKCRAGCYNKQAIHRQPAAVRQRKENEKKLLTNRKACGKINKSPGKIPAAEMNKGVFPSGQWGQTVNLLLNASVVRIHPRPPDPACENKQGFLFACRLFRRETPGGGTGGALFTQLQNFDSFNTIDTPINTPADLHGLKIRVQQSPTNVRMMELLGGSATPMGFGDVYTALQAQMLDGAENNELALTDNGHGDVCKYYSYTMHQMIPDILIGNLGFMEDLSEEERAIFDEGFEILNQTQREAWTDAVEAAKDKAQNEQGVNFIYPDIAPFQEAVAPMHEEMLADYPDLAPIYELIQEHNAEFAAQA